MVQQTLLRAVTESWSKFPKQTIQQDQIKYEKQQKTKLSMKNKRSQFICPGFDS